MDDLLQEYAQCTAELNNLLNQPLDVSVSEDGIQKMQQLNKRLVDLDAQISAKIQNNDATQEQHYTYLQLMKKKLERITIFQSNQLQEATIQNTTTTTTTIQNEEDKNAKMEATTAFSNKIPTFISPHSENQQIRNEEQTNQTTKIQLQELEIKTQKQYTSQDELLSEISAIRDREFSNIANHARVIQDVMGQIQRLTAYQGEIFDQIEKGTNAAKSQLSKANHILNEIAQNNSKTFEITAVAILATFGLIVSGPAAMLFGALFGYMAVQAKNAYISQHKETEMMR